MNERLAEALLAMDRLNSFARTQDGTGPRRAIYWLKSRYAIRDALMAGLLMKMRAIQVTTKCRRCREGVYYDWDGANRGRCYTCSGTGKVTLKFIETTINAPVRKEVIRDQSGAESVEITYADPKLKQMVWHSPVEYQSWLGWLTDDLQFEEAQDWTVNQPDNPMTAVELAEAMNIVEVYWPWWRKHSPYEPSRDEYDSCRYYLFNYALDLGCLENSTRCVFCGNEQSMHYNSTHKPGLTRAVPVCKTCGAEEDIWKRIAEIPLPQLHPAIEQWRTRHAFQFEASWGRAWHDPWIDRRIEEIKSDMAQKASTGESGEKVEA